MNLLRIPSLRWRLVVVMCVAYVIVAAVSGAAGYSAQSQSLHKELTARARNDAAILAAGAVVPLFKSKTTQPLQIFVTSVRKAQGVSYADIRNPDGCVAAHTKPVQGSPKKCQRFARVYQSRSLPDGSIMSVAPIVEDTDLGTAVVILSNASVRNDLHNALIQDVLVRLLGLALFVVLSLIIAQYILGPLTELSRAAIAIGGGRLGSRVPATGSTELATVGEAFNTMAAALEERIKHLTFLARSGARLPDTLREGESVESLLAEFGQVLNAGAAGLIETENEIIWCSDNEARCRAAVERVGMRMEPGIEEDDGLTIMTVPVPGDAVFIAARDALRPFTDEEQQVITNFAYQVGIATHNVRLFAAQQEALQVKDQFLSIVSHELRTPLTTIKGYAQMLRRKLAEDPDGVRFATSIDAQVSRLSRLVDDLLDVTRFSRGQFELTRRQVDLRPMLAEIASRFRVISQQHALKLDLGEGSLAGYWDRDRLEQVLNNLISNAIKYSPQGGTVTIRAFHENNHVVVSVRDEGIGIAEEEQQRLFERFYRGSNETQDIQGLGLGLYVTSRVVDAHGGEVRVRSKPGEGSEFSFTLPLSEVPEPAVPAGQDSAGQAQAQ